MSPGMRSWWGICPGAQCAATGCARNSRRRGGSVKGLGAKRLRRRGQKPTGKTSRSGESSDANTRDTAVLASAITGEVTPTYAITNTGNTRLGNLTLSGAATGAVKCAALTPDLVLMPGETVICNGPDETVSYGETLESPATMTARTLTATGASGTSVEANDPAFAVLPEYALPGLPLTGAALQLMPLVAVVVASGAVVWLVVRRRNTPAINTNSEPINEAD